MKMTIKPLVECAGCHAMVPVADTCQDGYCRACHKSIDFEECCDGSWVERMRREAGLPVGSET
jgi:hypothetical protein